MKSILFPATNRVHRARQQLLLNELEKHFEVSVVEYETSFSDILDATFDYTGYFKSVIRDKFDLVLIRADRFEMLPIAMMAAYQGVPIAHIEGGCETGQGVIDSKVRHAITQLSDIHFVTDSNAEQKVLYLGAKKDKVFNVGSLDVSFALSIEPKRIIKEDYILFLHHAIPGENTKLVYEAVKDLGYKVVGIKSNQDYAPSLMKEQYSPEDFINILRYAKCFVSNSSATCKEASILGTPCSLVGRRQDGRIVGHNTIRVTHDREEIQKVTKYQIEHGIYLPDQIYYQPDTEKRMCEILKEELPFL